MKIAEAKKVIEKMYEMDSPVFLWGETGIGKSAIVHSIFDEKDIPVVDVRLNVFDPTDLKGVPYLDIKNMVAKYIPLNLFKNDKRFVLFLDELNTAPQIIQNIAYQIVLDREINGEPINAYIIGAGNRENDGGFTFEMPRPLRRRFLAHIEVDANVDDWLVFMKDKLNPIVGSYLKFYPDRFITKNQKYNVLCPAVWTSVNDTLNKIGVVPEVLSGMLGLEYSPHFISHAKIYEKIDPIKTVNKKLIDKDSAVFVANIFGIISKVKDISIKALKEYVLHLIDKNYPEFALLIVNLVDMDITDELLEDERIMATFSELFDIEK